MEAEHHLWMFVVTGPGRFLMQVAGNPSLLHTGGVSVSALLLTEGQAAEVEAAIRGLGFRVVRRQSAVQTVEQRAERLAILGSEDTVFPCSSCPTCFWFDPLLPQLCGRQGWPDSMVAASLEAHAVAREQETACPVHPWRT